MAEARPDRILVGGTVWTGVPGDPPHPGWGVAIGAGVIQAVGPAEDLLNLEGPHTSVEHLPGCAIVPGFVDAHVHLLSGGLDLFRLELRKLRSPEELVQRVSDRARTTPPGEWILGGGWDENAWGGPLPHRDWLDRVTPAHPVFLLRTDLHVGLANSEALRRAGIDADTPDPPLGAIDRDPGGREPTGILREGGLQRMADRIPAPSPEDREAALQSALRLAGSRGITQLHDMGALQSAEESWASLEGLRALHRAGRLPIRVYAQLPLDERATLAALIGDEGRGDALLRWGGVKGFVDGSLGASTAWLREPYTHRPDHAGGPITDLDELEAGIRDAAAMGLQPINHAIGDRAVDWLLEVYERLPDGATPRIEHAQHLSPDALERVASSRVHLSMQPAHLVEDGPWIEERIGQERMKGAYPFRTLVESGAAVAFGSDWTVAPLDPMITLDAAIRRRDREGGSFGRDEGLTLPQALRAHTHGGARAAPWARTTGTLQTNRWADLAVLEPSPFDARAPLVGTQVSMTFAGGALVWRADDPHEDLP